MTAPRIVLESDHNNWRLQIRRSCHMVTQGGEHSPFHLTGSHAYYSSDAGGVERRSHSRGVTFDIKIPHVCPIRDVAVDSMIALHS
jgi:hypothetical protein